MLNPPVSIILSMLARNPAGKNQHEPILSDAEIWGSIIQKYIDQKVKVKDMSTKILAEHNKTISKCSIQRIIQTCELRTTRQPRMSPEEMEAAIVQVTAQDPLHEWGIRRVQEELQLDGKHIPRGFIEAVQKARDPEEAQRRWSGQRKIVRKTLFSSGPNEEWCMDGHEKLREAMGLDVWGICDKYSRLELGLWVVPNARRSQVPIALFLRLIKELQGVPLQLTGDKGSENGKVGILQTALRTYYAPSLSVETLPPVQYVRSVRNITRERAWRPLWEKDFKNILDAWTMGQVDVRYQDGNRIHKELGTWLWAKVTQARLDRARDRQVLHRIRIQKKVLLPTGGSPYEFYDNPTKFGATNMLIKIPNMSLIDELLVQNSANEYLQFGDDIAIALFEDLYIKVGSPQLLLENTWSVWRKMMDMIETGEKDVIKS